MKIIANIKALRQSSYVQSANRKCCKKRRNVWDWSEALVSAAKTITFHCVDISPSVNDEDALELFCAGVRSQKNT